MPLSVKEPIRAQDISAVDELKAGRVFLLTGHTPPVGEPERIVIKGEAVSQNKAVAFAKIRHGGITARLVDPGAELVLLSGEEKMALTRFTDRYRELIRQCSAEPGVAGNDTGRVLAALDAALRNSSYQWGKMRLQSLTTLEYALAQRANGHKTPLQRFIGALKGPDGLEKMGKIVAADSFIGNTDRIHPGFDPSGLRSPQTRSWLKSGKSDPKAAPDLKLGMKTFVNLGNIIVVAGDQKDRRFEASLLDYLDPASPYGDVDQDVDETYAMFCLADEAKRAAFVNDIIEDFETVLSPGRKRFDFGHTVLGGNAAARLEAGLLDGCRAILKHYEGRVMPTRPSANLQRRLNLLRRTLNLPVHDVNPVQGAAAPQQTLIGAHRFGLRIGVHRA
ncbi:hypothetical protein PUN4_10039 [Paraburkholderia unamae]|uniref:hypothetical protein n=1 Tax=Paraburkholderia unamae TaxID=219649 RepID=UPI001CAE3E81|nr:hypothetical protein PUN4_10039 [Paraburkholderia unamae]